MLRRLYPVTPVKDLGEIFKRSPAAVKSRAALLQLSKTIIKHHWTEAEDDLLREKFADTLTQVLATAMARSACAVHNRAHLLGLKKSAAHFLKLKEALRIADYGAKTRFKKGQVPPNKGVKGISYPGMEKTQFRPGTRPPNHKPVGTIRLESRDGYLQIKTAEGMCQWKQLHRVIWERMNGPIPRGAIVAFIDGDKMNLRITNMELLTKAQNATRNSVHRYGKEIASIYQLKGAVTRQINRREKASHE